MLEKLGAQNIQLNDHWVITENRLKCCFWRKKKKKKKEDKKAERLTGIQVSTKYFKSYQISCKSLRKKGTQLVKSVNYWQLVKLINQSTIFTNTHGQNNLIKFVESNKFDIFVWWNFLKIGRVLISVMMILQSTLRCWHWLYLVSWIGALTLSLLLKLPPRKLELWFFLWSFFPCQCSLSL